MNPLLLIIRLEVNKECIIAMNIFFNAVYFWSPPPFSNICWSILELGVRYLPDPSTIPVLKLIELQLLFVDIIIVPSRKLVSRGKHCVNCFCGRHQHIRIDS
jgi:hypothetical protein